MLNARHLTGLLTLSLTLSGLAACSSDDDGGDGGGTGGAATGGAATGGAATGGAATGGAATGGAATGGAATGGAATGGAATGGGANGETFPADTTSASIAAFLATEAYKSSPWIGDAAPRAAAGITSPHGSVRVYFNPAVAPSIGVDDATFAPDSMIVKEMYDSAGTLIGKAANLRVNPEDVWTFFCFAPGDLCGAEPADSTESAPIYGEGVGVDCGFCHANTISLPHP